MFHGREVSMVRLYSLAILKRKDDGTAQLLRTTSDLQNSAYFYVSTIKEFLMFTAKVLTERTQPSTRQSIRQEEYFCHVYVRADGLAGVAIADTEYPQRVAHTLLTKILEDFSSQIEPSLWMQGNSACEAYSGLEPTLQRYQNPREADILTRIQEELDETKIILHNAIEAVLERGENLETLVEKSHELSYASKYFYKSSRNSNSCCNFG